MVEHAHRTTRYRRLPDTLERLRAQVQESETINPVQHWLNQALLTPTKSTISPTRNPLPLPSSPHTIRQRRSAASTPRRLKAGPLSPTGGNRLPPYPSVKVKRKMSCDFTMNLRSKKIILAGSADEGQSAKGKEVVGMEEPQGQQKLKGKAREGDAVDESGDILRNEGQPSSEETPPERGQPATGMEIPHEVSLEESAPSRTSTSRSRKTQSPTKKKLPILTKRARMKFASPRIIFDTVVSTKQSGHLKGTLAQLWQHINRRESRVIPYEVKVNDPILISIFTLLIQLGHRKKYKKSLIRL